MRDSIRNAFDQGANLIVTYGSLASLAAKKEAPTAPILFVDVYDPVGFELVSAKSLTGRNMTGSRGDAPVQSLFNYFTEATKIRRLLVLYDVNSPEGSLQKSAIEDCARKKGIMLVTMSIFDTEGNLRSLETVPKDVEGIFFASSEHDRSQLTDVLTFASERHLPVMTQCDGAAEMGAFMVLETSVSEQGKKLAELAGQVLAGKKTDEIQMYKPCQISLIVNLKVARECGISVPFETLSVASRVIH